MESYKRGSHTVWDCKYHLVWVTKYRFPVLGGDVGQRCRELVRETARAHEMIIHAGSINRDHVHLLLSIPPSMSMSRAVQYLKGRSSHKLLSEFGSLRKRYWGQHRCVACTASRTALRAVLAASVGVARRATETACALSCYWPACHLDGTMPS
jgi:putative transposase